MELDAKSHGIQLWQLNGTLGSGGTARSLA